MQVGTETYWGVLRTRLLGDKGLFRGLTTNLVGVRLPPERTERDFWCVMGVSSIFIAACGCGVELDPSSSTRSLSAFDGILSLVVNTHCLKRLYFLMFSSSMCAILSRSAWRAS